MRAGHRWRAAALFLGVVALSAPSTAAEGEPSARSSPVDIVGNLNGVSASGPDDVWAVGNDASIPNYRTLIMHFDGSTWTRVPSPSPGGKRGSGLGEVSADSPIDAWAVGDYESRDLGPQPLVEHWNGTRWTVVPLPHRRKPFVPVFVSGVAALSPTNVWIVGTNKTRPLILHWDGSQWSSSSGVRLGGRLVTGSMNAVTANSPDDVWASGSYGRAGHTRQLLEHWDGTSWRLVESPEPEGGTGSTVWGIGAISRTNVWAVGEADAGDDVAPMSEHWTGTHWSTVELPQTARASQLFGVSGTGPMGAWAVGDIGRKGLIEHWDGSAWSLVDDNVDAHVVDLEQVVAISPRNAWVVGGTGFGDSGRLLIEHWDGSTWTPISA
jgi:hypothetical protein